MELIYGSGFAEADLFIVADYARKHDSTTKQGLSGYYARKIGSLLSDSNYSVDRTYRTCLLKEYITGLGVGTWGQDKKVLEAHYEFNTYNEEYMVNLLIEEINLIKPAVILILGEYALRVLTDKEGISKWRGSVIGLTTEIEGRLDQPIKPKCVIAQHPGILHQQEEQEFIMRLDFKKAVDLIFQPNKPIDYHEVRIARTASEFLTFRNRYPDNPQRMTTDIETHLGFITCASVSYDGHAGITIPMFGARIDMMDKCRMMHALAQDLENPLIVKGNQNIGYDKRIYQRFGFRVNPIGWDTMLAAHTIAAEYPKNLGFLTSIYTDMSYYKDEGRDFDPSRHSFDRLYEYCAKDSISTFQIWDRQIKDLKDMEQYDFFINFVMPLFDLYYNMESVGFPINIQKRDELIAKYEGLASLKYLELKSIIGQDININSPTQIGKYMESNMFPVLRHRVPSGFMVVNTDGQSMNKMKTYEASEYKGCKVPYEHALRFIELILLLKRIDKVLEYINVGIHPWGRVHTSVKVSGTTSARTSNGQTSDGIPVWVDEKGTPKLRFKQLGQSFQTVTKHGFIVEDEETEIEDGIIGKDVREIYSVDKGYAIVEIDRSQAEARVCDLLAEDYEGLEEYGRIDKHCKVASMIFTDYTYEDILRLSKKEKTDEGEFMRFIGKKGKHANNLDVGPFVLSMAANITFREAKNILSKLDRAYPRTKATFHKGIEDLVRSTRTLINPYGRKRIFYKKLDGHGLKVALSWYPQSTISDGTKLAMVRGSERIDKDRAWFVGENHDSITAIVKWNYIRKYVLIIKEELERPIDFRIGNMPRDYDLKIPTDVSIGRRDWGNLKEIKMKRVRLVA